LFQYNELVRNLTIKEFKLRYRNSVLGFVWYLLNPLAMIIILTLVFSTLLKSGIENFPVFLLTALLAWRFFSISTSMSLSSIIGNSPLVTKIYFPRWLLVLSSNLASLMLKHNGESHLRGNVDDDELPNYYAASDLLVLPA